MDGLRLYLYSFKRKFSSLKAKIVRNVEQSSSNLKQWSDNVAQKFLHYSSYEQKKT